MSVQSLLNRAALALSFAVVLLGGDSELRAEKIRLILAGDKYGFGSESEQRGIDRDVYSMEQFFKNAFPDDEERAEKLDVVSLQPEKDMTPERILETIRNLEIDPKDTVVFFYSGHAGNLYEYGGQYFALSGGDPQAEKQPLLRNDLERELQNLGAKITVVVTDCCNMAGSPMGKDFPYTATPKIVNLLFFEQPQSTFVSLTSSEIGQASWVDGYRSIGVSAWLDVMERLNKELDAGTGSLSSKSGTADAWRIFFDSWRDRTGELYQNYKFAKDKPTEQPLGVGRQTPCAYALPGATRFGVGLLSYKNGGVLIQSVIPGSPADTAGLLPWDVIAKVNDAGLQNEAEFSNIVEGAAENEELKLEIKRGTNGIFHEFDFVDGIGIEVEKADPDEQGETLSVISKVDDGSPGQAAGLKEGSIVLAVDGVMIEDGNIVKLGGEVDKWTPGRHGLLVKPDKDYGWDGKLLPPIFVKLEGKPIGRNEGTDLKLINDALGLDVRFGPYLQDNNIVDEDKKSLIVNKVDSGGSAEKAGLMYGDFITELDGQDVSTLWRQDFDKLATDKILAGAETLELTYVRGDAAPAKAVIEITDEVREAAAEINSSEESPEDSPEESTEEPAEEQDEAEPEAAQPQDEDAVDTTAASIGFRTEGVAVAVVAEGSLAWKAGIAAGSRILEINGRKIENADQIESALQANREKLVLKVARDAGITVEYSIPLKKQPARNRPL